MNNINDLFDELFRHEENKQTVLLYLSSFMGHKNNPQDLSVKMHQAQLLQVYLENSTVSNKEFYIELLKIFCRFILINSKCYQIEYDENDGRYIT